MAGTREQKAAEPRFRASSRDGGVYKMKVPELQLFDTIKR
jgi:hypothetical protein